MNHNVNLIGQRPDLRTDLLLRWKLDEVSGDALDSSGNAFSGTVSGATQNQVGHLNRAYAFDGVNDNVVSTAAGLTTALESINTLTIAFWAKTGSFALNDTVISFGVSDDDDTLSLYPFNTVGGNGFAVWYDGEFIVTSAGSAPADDTYHHFCYRQNGATTHELFVDGVSVATDATSKTTAASVDGVSVGSYIGTIEFYDGDIDDPRIWTRALTDQQILTLAQM